MVKRKQGIDLSKRVELVKQVVLYAVITIGALVMLLPFFWMIATSFKLPSEIISYPPTWIPHTPTLNNFIQVWKKIPILRYYINSGVVTSSVTAICVFLSALAGFGFAKYQFWGRTLFFILILSTLMIPFQITMIPLYLLIAKLGLVNTYWGIIAPSIGSAFGTFLIRQYIQTIPDDLLDASRLDGCSEFRIFWRIILPLCKPVLATLAIFMVIMSWNEFMWPLIIIDSPDMRTLPVGLVAFKGPLRILYGELLAASVCVVLPVIVVFVLMQKYIIKAFTLTGIKG